MPDQLFRHIGRAVPAPAPKEMPIAIQGTIPAMTPNQQASQVDA